ncbi:hypothetical protein GCM10027589_14950 [Actinocorallia lasiicapitis]
MARMETATAGASARARQQAYTTRNERTTVAAVLGVSALVLAAGLTDWPSGLVCGVAVAGAYYARAMTRPGAETDWRRGAAAERRTGRELKVLEGRGYTVLHDRSVPELESTNLDHLVIGLTGVYAVITRRVRRGARLSADGGLLWAGERQISGIERTAALAGPLVARLLSAELDKELTVTPIVAVQPGSPDGDGLEYGGVRILRGRAVAPYVRAHPVVYTTAQVATIVAAAERIFPPMVGIAK